MCSKEPRFKFNKMSTIDQVVNNAQYYKERNDQFTFEEMREIISEIDKSLRSTAGDAGTVDLTARQATILLGCWHNLRCTEQGADWEHLCEEDKECGPISILNMVHKLAKDLV